MKSLPYLPFVCVLICICGWSSFVSAQAPLPDSLQALTADPTFNEKEKPPLLNQLAEIYRANKNYSLAMATARQSVVLSLRHQNYLEATKAYAMLANIKFNTQQYDDLKQTVDSVFTSAQQANHPVAMAYAFYIRALLYKTLDKSDDVVKYCQLGLRQLDKTPDPYMAAKMYYQLYVVNSGWNNEEKVSTYARQATDNALKANDFNLLSNCYTALSVAHEYKFNATKNRQELDSVLYYLGKTETLYQQYPGRVAANPYAIACINIANSYLKYFPVEDARAKAQAAHYANVARTVLKDAANSEEVVASSLGILSEYARREGNEAQAENYLLEAYQVMKTANSHSYYTMINVVQSLSDFYEQKGNYRKALEFQKEATLYNNKVFNQQQALNTQKLEIQYETEKKNNEMQILKEREKSRTMQNYLYACIALASLLGLVFMFRSYHFRLRYSMQREKQLQLEKHESEMQVKLEKEEHARLRAEQQLLATRQQQLKKEVMANVLHLEHKHQTLLNIKDKLTEGDAVNMQKILKEEMVIDNDFEHAKVQIQQIHPDFFHLINEKAQKKLTLLDLKLCAYLYLKMDTRQIAQLMNIEAKSVRMSRYRIKQKLGLDREDDLNAFLQALGS
ncbi:DNA-binding CsgD family transcriptional regulator [Chitinophaga sp. W3I9]|uniref:helix-turn-helix transcriptional regulator n=1 Tax=Chitinophaga sp. W3I9 TaxID=3373924 RepID=UPI003D1990DD